MWEAAYRIVGWHAWVLPSPSFIADGLLDLLNIHTCFGNPLTPGWPWPAHPGPPQHVWDSPMVAALLVSGQRLLIGFGIGSAAGGVLGLAMWRWRFVDGLLGPLLLGLQTLPSVCWVPIAILAFGYSEPAIQLVLVMGSFTAFALSLRDGLHNLPPLYRRAGLMMGASGWRLYAHVLLPASLPAVSNGLRQGFSFAWRSLMGGEFVFAVQRRGLGFLLQASRDQINAAQVLGLIGVMIAIGMAADRLVFARVQAWVSRRFGLVAAT